MNKNQKKLPGALVAVIAMSVTAASGIAPGEAQADGESVSSVLDGGLFTVLRHQEDAVGHEGAVIMSVATTDDKSTHALAFMQTIGDYAGKGMVCGVAKPGDKWLRCVSDQPPGDVVEVLTVGNLDSGFCRDLREELGKEAPGKENPIMLPDDCDEKYPNNEYPNAACICYQIEHLKPAIEVTADTVEKRNPPGRGSGSGGHE